MKHESFNESVEMYLKTVSELAADDGLAPISALAQHLGISAVSATEMVHRLGEQGLVDHVPYKGVALTESGAQHAHRVIRRHRLWECFLSEHLRLGWQHVHDYACQLEHATTDEVADAMAAFLGQPVVCPHGNPIPDRNGRLAELDDEPLSEWRPGDRGALSRIYPESYLLLDYLEMHNIQPGRTVVVTELAPFNGPMMVQIGGLPHALGHEIAAHIYGIRQNDQPD